ncbi:Aminodeoxychorismate synthase [Erysiphe neolycopersici]|uniref:aminodeoxychorismate synthase n=1 Tax=Erysiphe neolycopersici TaxID=212602 RepID=A0A420I4Y2_9PEZI|nr:Aminodeoxychorismate synthase [Erysiphe neolycopersici]
MLNKPLILFIDAYDSFSNNIISLLETTLDVTVRTVKIDNPVLLASKNALYSELRNYAAVVCGPGPGSAENERDVGLMKHIWNLSSKEMLPVLGICLGFQSLCFEFGGIIRRLKGPQHGIVRNVTHVGSFGGKKSIFHEVGNIYATLYQSLCVDIGHDAMSREELEKNKWQPTDQCPDLLPLAWVEDDLTEPNDSGIKDEKILVGIQHTHHPFWALQYHPESICTNNENRRLIQNWFQHAIDWNQRRGRKCVVSEDLLQGHSAIHRPLSDKSVRLESVPHCSTYHIINESGMLVTKCFTRKIKLPIGMSIPEIVERVQETDAEHILLESSNAAQSSAVKGRFSIIGLDIDRCTRIEYNIGQNCFKIVTPQPDSANSTVQVISEQLIEDVWSYIASQLKMLKNSTGNVESPFWGGFMGYTTYELGLERIGLNLDSQHYKMRSRPDLCFVWVNSSIVVDHANSQIYIQKLAPLVDEHNVNHWIENMAQNVNSKTVLSPSTENNNVNGNFLHSQSKLILHPDELDYQSKVLDCQSHIQAGLSYELCLTDQTLIHLQGPDPSWDIYKQLRLFQPAPFASYIRLGPATFISASPEQFLKWDENGQCELRPMKGTVKKSSIVSSLTKAAALLHKPKEKAENLMIVDLARHDLHGICGSGNVTVPRLMVIEEYASVFQMVSKISGKIQPLLMESNISALHEKPASNAEIQGCHTGLDVLATSLPPGSMTGAPKKKSCQILREIEGKERSLYSGVVGYVDVRGRGDWSVNIRCLFKWDDEVTVTKSGETTWKYHIGAGGAVTTLSTAFEEKEEMLAKLEGILRIFKD